MFSPPSLSAMSRVGPVPLHFEAARKKKITAKTGPKMVDAVPAQLPAAKAKKKAVTAAPKAIAAPKKKTTSRRKQTETAPLFEQVAPTVKITVPVAIRPVIAPLTAASPQLSASQQKAVESIEAGQNVFVTGPAGSGKSFLIEYLAKRFNAAVTATTGLAALNINGQTVNKWAGIGIADEKPQDIIQKLKFSRWAQPILAQVKTAKLLIIDEVSMLSAHTFDVLDAVLRGVRECDKPFGGIQVALFGDFLQLPPVVEAGEEAFCFNSKAWKDGGFGYIGLDKVFRQKDEIFAQALHNIRIGAPTEADLALLGAREGLLPDDGIRPIHLFPTNRKVDELNQAELAKIPGDAKTYLPTDEFAFIPNKNFAEQQKMKGRWREQFDRNCLATNPLVLKVNAQVMLLKNLSNRLVNGSMGIVTQMLDNAVKVKFAEGEEVLIERKKWELKEGPNVVAIRHHIPLRLAWGLSIHKSQGQTLDRVYVDLNDVFEKGQAYVALSRVKTLAGLFLKGFHPDKIFAHPDAIAFYKRMTGTH